MRFLRVTITITTAITTAVRKFELFNAHTSVFLKSVWLVCVKNKPLKSFQLRYATYIVSCS